VATASRVPDTTGAAGRSGAVSGQISFGFLPGDAHSTTGRSTRPTTRGTRTSVPATRTTGTRTTATELSSSEEAHQPSHAAPSFADLYQAYYDCRTRKRNTHSALRFEVRLERNLVELYEELVDGSYRPGRSICFGISRPKFREVWAADFRDRIVHHLLYNHIGPRFERAFIADSCACMKGRGTLYAAKRLDRHARSITQDWSRDAFYLKCDLSNFFNRIDKTVLWRLLQAKIHEPWWLGLCGTILWHDCRDNYEVRGDTAVLAKVPANKRLTNQPAGFGLPIGNLPSQFFANVILDPLDQRMKHRNRARHYVRYVDDFVVLGRSPQWLEAVLADANLFLPDALHLELNPKKTILQPCRRGIDFVGQVIRPEGRITRRRTVRQAVQNIETVDAGELMETANAYFGIVGQAPVSRNDRIELGRAVRRRGFMVNGDITKTYRSALA